MGAIQLTVGELELAIASYCNRSDWAALVKFGDTKVDIEYEYTPGERAILDRAPEDCQPGWPASVAIWSIKTAEPMTYEAEGVTTAVDAGVDIFHLVSRKHIDQLEDEILKSVRQEAFA